jgi:tRNA (guanine37-N1)-methyltransferase
MKFHAITIFPKMFHSYLNEGILKRALDKKIISFETHNLRDWTTDKHQSVDDTPYGGGAGMLMKIEPLYKAIKAVKKNKKNCQVILMSASGKKWNQQLAQKYSKSKEVVFICGRYEGVDARISEFIDDEISIGDYVLTGGELPALIIMDSISRLLPGVLGNDFSSTEESHSEQGILEYPQYTKPAVFIAGRKKYEVPEVLLGGNHKEIAKWRKENQKKS